MNVTRTTVAILVGAGVVAGAAGALVTTRGGESAAPAPAAVSGPAVEESEGVVSTPIPEARPEEPVRTVARPAPVARSVPAARPRPRSAPPAPAVPESPAPVAAAPPPLVPAPIELPRIAEAPPAIPQPRYEDLELAAQSVIGLQLETSVSSETARVEDEVIAHVTRDVRVGDRVAIPAGAKAHGEVTLVERGARLRDRARLGVRFTSIVLADGTRVPIDTEAIYREGSSVRNENAAKIGGGAIGGAIIGGILGGAKGAAIGGSIGAGAGTAAVVADGRNAATLPSGSPVTVRIESPVTVTVER